MTRNPIKLLQWNARSLYRSKLEEFKNNLRKINPHLVLLSETHWNEKYIHKFSAFNSIYINRQGQEGGVAILVKKTIQYTKLLLPRLDTIEATGIPLNSRMAPSWTSSRPTAPTVMKLPIKTYLTYSPPPRTAS